MIGLSFAAPAAKLCELWDCAEKPLCKMQSGFCYADNYFALDGIGEAAEPVALHVLDPARVARRRDGGVDGQLGRVGDAVLGGNGLNVALAEDGVLLAAVRAGVVAMFSTMPSTGTCIMSAMLTALSTIMPTSSCGDVTTTTPATGRDWNTVSGTSPVPGGMSTNI